MIRTLTGKVTSIIPQGVVVEVAGVGYLVAMPVRTLPKIDAEIKLFIYHHLREDRNELYGFITEDELTIFEHLLSVPSIGPKSALNILSSVGAHEIAAAIKQGQLEFFNNIPGLGKKSAQKIIMELKDKITIDSGVALPQTRYDLILALKSLGYDRESINKTIEKIPQELNTLPEQVQWSIKQLGR